MLTRVEALNFRCLRYVSRPLDRFHVLVGPNGSGKTTFLDVVGFVSRLLNDGLEAAIEEVTPNPLDMMFGRKGKKFELAIEARLPSSLPVDNDEASYTFINNEILRIRYELSVVLDKDAYPKIDKESVRIIPVPDSLHSDAAGLNGRSPYSLMSTHANSEVSVRRNSEKTEYFREAMVMKKKLLKYTASLPSDQSALANLIEDLETNPGAIWLKKCLKDGIALYLIDGKEIRLPSPPTDKRHFQSNGRSMPWARLEMKEHKVKEWIEHIQTALPEIVGIRPVIREEDRHCYLMLKYDNGVEIPQWMVSDGTLRLLALTLPAFSDLAKQVLLVEEPENGIHPKAIETVYQALSTVESGQVLVTTHSPVVVNIADPKDMLCFCKDKDGAVDIVRGDEHPTLEGWQHEVPLGTLFAAGALE